MAEGGKSGVIKFVGDKRGGRRRRKRKRKRRGGIERGGRAVCTRRFRQDRGERIISWELGGARDAATNFSYPPTPDSRGTEDAT